MKPFFAEKNNPTKHITLIEGDDIVSEDFKVAEVMNDVFATTQKRCSLILKPTMRIGLHKMLIKFTALFPD